MNKFKEILLLSNLKRVGKATIYGKYWDVLCRNTNVYDLISDMEVQFSIPYSDLETALKKAEATYDIVENDPDISVITVFDDNYPKQLEIMEKKRPLILYIKGNEEALFKPNISVIGTRKPSEQSKEFEEALVKNIVNETDRVVVSGLALGCDRIAHKATVDENKITVAVLPSGVNIIKPKTNQALAMDIIDKGGCLVSEYEPNKDAYKSSYVQRDQIVAALSDAVFVVECGVKSGTMHTVDFAGEYNKPIFTFLPQNKLNSPYDGNEYIFAKKNGIKVSDNEDFSMLLNESIKEDVGVDVIDDDNELKSESKQQTLDFF